MEWKHLKEEEELNAIKDSSNSRTFVIFKHSTRCSISSTALNRLERSWGKNEMENVEPYYLDLITYRNISNKIAELFGVQHQSPQVLVIKDGKCIYHESHLGIQYDEVKVSCSALN